MEMKIPKEPKNLKALIEARRKELGVEYRPPSWEHYSVWYGSNYKIPSNLWREWKEELKAKGFTWPKFLKLLSFRKTREQMVQWSRGEISWASFVEKGGQNQAIKIVFEGV